MIEIGAYEAKTRISEPIKAEAGETVVVPRRGRCVARIVPEPALRRVRVRVRETLERVLRGRDARPPLRTAEIPATRDEGRRL